MESHLWRHQLLLGARDPLCCEMFCWFRTIQIDVFSFTCIVAESFPFFPSPVQPSTEAHEDNPAGPSQTSNERWLLHHVWDAVVALWSCHYIFQFSSWRHRTWTSIHTEKTDMSKCQFMPVWITKMQTKNGSLKTKGSWRSTSVCIK